MVKVLSFFKRKSGTSVEELQRHWRKRHADLVVRLPGLRRYVQCHVYGGIYAAGRQPPHDGAPISWFDDLEALRAAGATQQLRATRADEPNFMVTGRLPFVIAGEIEIPL